MATPGWGAALQEIMDRPGGSYWSTCKDPMSYYMTYKKLLHKINVLVGDSGGQYYTYMTGLLE